MKENKRKDMTYYLTEAKHSLDMLARYMSARTQACRDCIDDCTVHGCTGCSKGAERVEILLNENDPARVFRPERARSIAQLVDLGEYLRTVSDPDVLQSHISVLLEGEATRYTILLLKSSPIRNILEYIDGYLEELKGEQVQVISDGKD